jgi:NAD(P)-dependent dehydrogenase (short-subunit alcohol dehydrogenase family)
MRYKTPFMGTPPPDIKPRQSLQSEPEPHRVVHKFVVLVHPCRPVSPSQTCFLERHMQIKDSVIIITGGGQGLGRSMAEYLAGRGARLALVDLNPERLEEAVKACTALGTQARPYICNVANEEQVVQTVNQIADDFGAINGLINNAGILRDGLLLKARDGEIQKMSLTQWQSVIDVNLTSVTMSGTWRGARRWVWALVTNGGIRRLAVSRRRRGSTICGWRSAMARCVPSTHWGWSTPIAGSISASGWSSIMTPKRLSRMIRR